MSDTPFQPNLPAEILATDAEFAFIDDSPPRLFPENQDSNYGLLRKIFSDWVQELIGQQDEIYLERFVASSTEFLDQWEIEVGLPPNPPSKTVAQRREEVLLRLERGPFTRTRRATIVERYIAATFGAPVEITSDGVILSAGGVPLFAEGGSLAGSYTILENLGEAKNLQPNSNFEVDLSLWTAQHGTVVQDGSNSKFGSKSALWTATDTISSNGFISNKYTGITAGQPYSFSAYVKRGAGTRNAAILVSWYTAADVLLTSVASGYQNMFSTNFTRVLLANQVAPATAAKATTFVTFTNGGGTAIGDSMYIDAVQAELGTAATIYKDGDRHALYYEVRILSSFAPDMVGLERELTRITPAGISHQLVLASEL